jgi:hypothetical protein
MKAFYVLACVIVAVVAAEAAATKGASTQEKHPIDWYDCSGKRDGNYVHPSDCTRFISCSGSVASERDCANCHVDSVTCPEGRLVYNSTQDECLYADQTRCEGGGDDGPTETEEPAPTTQGPPGPTNATEAPVTSDPTTEASPQPPQEGDACNPELCKNEGYCQSYLRCDKDTGKLVREECGENLAWNPLNPNGTEQIHGGNCDLWENLSADVEGKYRSDPECLACFWRALGECSAEYDYQPPNGTHRNVLRLTCADGLVFSQDKETCQRCEDVTRGNGTTCC